MNRSILIFKGIAIAIGITAVFMLTLWLVSDNEIAPVVSNARVEEINAEIIANQNEWKTEAPLAARGKLAERKMSNLSQANAILREELKMLQPDFQVAAK